MKDEFRKHTFGLIAALLLVAATIVACSGESSSTSGTGATPTGGSCGQGASCSGGICATSQDFPSGYCTQGCDLGNPSSCTSGTVCIDDASGAPADAGIKALCYQSCTSDTDCTRTGYKCLEKASHKVCRNGA
jgi:hypothetical protein